MVQPCCDADAGPALANVRTDQLVAVSASYFTAKWSKHRAVQVSLRALRAFKQRSTVVAEQKYLCQHGSIWPHITPWLWLQCAAHTCLFA